MLSVPAAKVFAGLADEAVKSAPEPTTAPTASSSVSSAPSASRGLAMMKRRRDIGRTSSLTWCLSGRSRHRQFVHPEAAGSCASAKVGPVYTPDGLLLGQRPRGRVREGAHRGPPLRARERVGRGSAEGGRRER